MCIYIPQHDDQPYYLDKCVKGGPNFYFRNYRDGRLEIIGNWHPWRYDICFDNIHGNRDENYIMRRYRKQNHINQSQEVIEHSDFTYTMKNISGKCWQPQDGNTRVGTALVQNTCNNSSLQKWRLILGNK